MRKYLQITLVAIAFLGLLIGKAIFKGDNKEEGQVQAPVLPTQTAPTAALQQSSSANSSVPTSASAPSSNAKFKNGTYTGTVEDAFYGNIQVQAVITGGKLSDVVFLQYPNDNRTSMSINSQASVYLKEEALAAQSSNVNIVTGASDSSMAFQRSLSSALRQAQI